MSTLWQQFEGPEHLEIRPRAIAALIGKPIVVEVDSLTGNRDPKGTGNLHSITVASGICMGARRQDRNGLYGPETTLFFQGQHAISFKTSDLVLITDLSVDADE